MDIQITRTARKQFEALPKAARSEIRQALDQDQERGDEEITLESLGEDAFKVLRLHDEQLAVLYKEADQVRTVVTIVPLSGLPAPTDRPWPIGGDAAAPESIKIGHEVLSKTWKSQS